VGRRVRLDCAARLCYFGNVFSDWWSSSAAEAEAEGEQMMKVNVRKEEQSCLYRPLKQEVHTCSDAQEFTYEHKQGYS
jgi:hypothetical protein